MIPHLSHLLAVAGIVIEDLSNEDEAIAGLLHDVLEDQDPAGTRAAEIEDLFGSSVLAMVACSSPKKEDPGMAEFRVRKQIALDHLTVERNVGALRLPWRTRCTMRVAQSTISKQRAWLSATPGAARAPAGRARRQRTRMPGPGDPRQRCRRDPPAAPAVRGS